MSKTANQLARSAHKTNQARRKPYTLFRYNRGRIKASIYHATGRSDEAFHSKDECAKVLNYMAKDASDMGFGSWCNDIVALSQAVHDGNLPMVESEPAKDVEQPKVDAKPEPIKVEQTKEMKDPAKQPIGYVKGWIKLANQRGMEPTPYVMACAKAHGLMHMIKHGAEAAIANANRPMPHAASLSCQEDAKANKMVAIKAMQDELKAMAEQQAALMAKLAEAIQ